MKVSREEILHIANLAQLEIKEEEIEEYRKNLDEILQMAEIVNNPVSEVFDAWKDAVTVLVGNNYSMDDLLTVIDNDYSTAASLASQFSTLINALPSVDKISTSDADTISAIRDVYNNLTSYQRSFISSDDLTRLQELEQRVKELSAASESDSSDTTDEADAKE